MKEVFADTLFWIARFNVRDQWHEAARIAYEELPSPVRLVTTEEVLSEFLTRMSKQKSDVRESAVEIVRSIMSDSGIETVPQTHRSFLNGIDLYASRKDKQYSMQDCISMNVMRSRSIFDVLTRDRHFEQEGFRILMK